jgi:oligopeptide/dipeptide ABC transporter ATP-binding protein
MVRAFLRAPSAIVGLGMVAVILLASVVGPPLISAHAAALDVFHNNQNPTTDHLLGTDQLGRDILARVVVATRLSITLAVSAAILGAAIGIPTGAAAALLSPRFRAAALRAIDTLLAFPPILVAIFVGAIVGPGALSAALGVGIAISFSFARVASALTLSIGGREYMAAARVVGVRGSRLMLRYVLPNVAETLTITTAVAMSSSIVSVSALSFLGLGVQSPDFDWGKMLTVGVQSFYITPAAALGPAVAIAVTALAFGFTGEALARAMNPILWTGALDKGFSGARTSPDRESPEHPVGTPATKAMPVETVLEVTDLFVTFPGPSGPYAVVDGVSFRLAKGEKLGVVGESGSGKTMMAMAIAQLTSQPATVSGVVLINGKNVRRMGQTEMNHFLATDLAVVFQDPTSSLNPALRIGTQLTEGAQQHRHLTHRQALDLAVVRLSEVNISTPLHQLGRHPHELSGGMRQRVMIAMGLMNNPILLIADEPTTALDVTIQAQIMDLLERINADHQTAIVLISHNLALVSQNCHRVLVMYAGRIVEDLSTEQLLLVPLHPYTRALRGAVPDMSRPRDVDLDFISGQPPDPLNLPSGCPYHPRCPLAIDICKIGTPPLQLRPDGRRVACWVANGDLR